MLLKKLITIILIIIIFIFLFTVDKNIDNNNLQNKKIIKSYKTINFAMERWPGFLITPLANKLGYFKDEGLTVNIKIYDSSTKLENDILDNLTDARAAYSGDIVNSVLTNKKEEQIILVADYSLGGDGLVARKNAPNINTVKNPKVGFSGEIDFFVLWVFKKINVDIKNIKFVFYDSEEKALQGLNEGAVDYLITYNPYLSDAVNNEGKIIYSSKDDPGVITDVIAFQKSFIDKNRPEVDAFTKAYFKAYDYWLNNKKISYELVKEDLDMSVSDIEIQMNDLKMADIYENNMAMNISPGLKSLYGNLRIINLVYKNYIPDYKIKNTDEFIYPTSVKILNNP